MPAPPTEIRIKRKATDDPVELLHVQNEYNGLRQIKQYVFKRQRTSTTPNNNILNPLNSSLRAQQPAILFSGENPVAKASQPFEAPVAYSHGLEQTSVSLKGTLSNASMRISMDQSSGPGTNRQSSITSKPEPRRFHLSRSSIRGPTGTTSAYIRGAKGPLAVFIERRRVTELDSQVSDAPISRELSSTSQNASSNQHPNGDGKAQLPSNENQPRLPAPLRNVRLPSGKVVPWDADPVALAAEMQAYTLQEIGHNLAKASTPETSTTSTPIIRARQVSSFKPKAPALRYHERHPNQTRATDGKKGPNQDEIMTDVTDATDPDGDEAGYVMDTYVRMPAEMFEFQEQKSIGLLVLDSQPDIDDFYNDDSDSDSEIYDEEEDENAENHPSTDYPEDEVESDDEYGRNPYKRYRNRNASDNEEYDEDDVTYSGDEAKPQWARRPWMANNAYHRNEEGEEDDY